MSEAGNCIPLCTNYCFNTKFPRLFDSLLQCFFLYITVTLFYMKVQVSLELHCLTVYGIPVPSDKWWLLQINLSAEHECICHTCRQNDSVDRHQPPLTRSHLIRICSSGEEILKSQLVRELQQLLHLALNLTPCEKKNDVLLNFQNTVRNSRLKCKH